MANDEHTEMMQLRITRGASAADAGADHDEPQSMLIDTLTNLMHWAAFTNNNPTVDAEWENPQVVDFDEALRIARDHFDAEQAGEE
jgi:hypothetical protein